MKNRKITSYGSLLPVSRPAVGRRELREVERVFASGWLGLGKTVFQFESRLKEYLGAKQVIAVSNGTNALHLALDSIGIKQKDEVIVPSFTFAATVQSILHCGARPVFCDIRPDTLNIDPDDMGRWITRRTKAVIPVHYGGLSCDMRRILRIARQRNIRVVEDAAHAFGSLSQGRKIGSFGDITCFSFDPVKNITCGEGGAITTADGKLARIIYNKRILGIDKDTWSRYRHRRDWFYKVTALGYRYHMSNINAAIGLSQLKNIEEFIQRRREIVMRYDRALSEVPQIEIPRRDYANTAFFNYVIKVRRWRDELIGYLKGKGIDSGVHYIPNHLQPFFAGFRTRLPVTEKAWKQIISLPLFYGLTDKQVDSVADNVRSFFKTKGNG